MKKKLSGITALVTGASRGVGKGIAIGIGEYGARVYITGRDENDLRLTAKSVQQVGGSCIPILCDHSVDSDSRRVFEQIQKEGSRISILVNNAWGGYEQMMEDGKFTWENKYWDQSIRRWDKMFSVGVRSVFINSKYAMAVMKREEPGLIVNLSFWAAKKYISNIIYGAAKAATDKLSADMAFELKDSKLSVVSLYPGLVRTEEVLRNEQFFDLSNSESPQFIGRVIAGLFLDPCHKTRSGTVLIAAALAREYGIKDIDNRQPIPLEIGQF